MKIHSLSRIALVAFALGTVGLTSALADDAPPAADHGGHQSVLTDDERAQLKKDRDQVFASDTALKTEDDTLKQQRDTMSSATPADKSAFRDKWRQHMQKMNDAIVKLDPSAAPLIEKMKAAHHHDAPPAQ